MKTTIGRLSKASVYPLAERDLVVTNTFGDEATIQPKRIHALLHADLMRNLGIAFSELAWLDDLPADWAADLQYDFLYTAGPLKVVVAAGAPANPVAIK